MAEASYFNVSGEELEKVLQLRTSPIALKFVKSESEIPPGAVRPKRDRGMHLATCQAFSMARREKASVALLKEDHWCWAPLVGYGLVKCNEGDESFQKICEYLMVEDPERAKEHLAHRFPRLAHGDYAGLVMAPLRSASFDPDVVLIYSNPAQLRTILLAVKYKTGTLLTSHFDPIDSCVFAVVPPFLDGEYRITLPDVGEYQRAAAGEDEIIFSVPARRMEELMSGLRYVREIGFSYSTFGPMLQPDFPQPEFYKDLFRTWGLDEAK